METKALELRDRSTFIPILCIDMNVGYFEVPDQAPREAAEYMEASMRRRHKLMRRVGYPCDGRPNIMMTKLAGRSRADNDPYGWGDRTFATAHLWIIEHWRDLKDGDVVDVQWILGETSEPATSEA